MRYLAQYLRPDPTYPPHLKLLAQQQLPHVWKALEQREEDDTITLSQPLAVPTDVPAPDLLAILQTDRTLAPGSLLLVDLERDSLVRWESAIPWLLDIVSHYLSHGEDPAFLATERIRLEAWRQELTLEQQELGRKLLEVEARIAKFYDSETPSQLQQP